MGNAYYLRPGVPFLPAVADAWIRAAEAHKRPVSQGRIIVPSRRAVRSLSSAFLEASRRQAVLLPRITPLSDLDEVSLFFSDGLKLLPAVRDTRRLAILSALIAAKPSPSGQPISGAAAWALARDLGRLMDEATREGVVIDREKLVDLVEGDLATHWQDTVRFLDIITDVLPRIMRQNKGMSPEERRVALMKAQSDSWSNQATEEVVWLAGLGFASYELAAFARSVHRQPNGAIILSGFDPDVDVRDWDAGQKGKPHPSCGGRLLLDRIGLTREDVLPLETAVPHRGCPDLARDIFGDIAIAAGRTYEADRDRLALIQARDEHEEDRAIALALRHELETPDQSVAFVTPSKDQAARVAAHLRQYGIHAEDSAGDPILSTPPGVFIKAITDAVESGFDPVALLAVLKNPFASVSGDPRETRRLARKLELQIIRRLHPSSGLDALVSATRESKSADLLIFVNKVAEAFAPLASSDPNTRQRLPDVLTALLASADRLTAGQPEDLWSGEAGSALSAALVALSSDVDNLISVAPGELAAFLTEALSDVSVRRPRNKDAHARVAIWGVLEARLQHVDTVIIGGLVEGTFPAQSDPGPWLSRPMRRRVGLPDPEQKIAEQALDFSSLLCSAKRVILASPARSGGAPAVPSRFLSRLLAVTGGLASHPAPSWVRQSETPGERIQRPPPAPVPPLDARPKRFTISDVGVLMTDPYAFYARRVLGIRQVDSLARTSDTNLFGDVVHNGYMLFFKDKNSFLEGDAASKLFSAFVASLPAGRPSAGTLAWWHARLQRVADWCVRNERSRIASQGEPRLIALEVDGSWPIGDTGILVEGRADRIEIGADGLASILDYKTGTVPSAAMVAGGTSPQLPIEAAMVRAGGFGPDLLADVTELAYWKLSGATLDGKVHLIYPDRVKQIIEDAEKRIPEILIYYSACETAFLDAPHPSRPPAARPYDGISRRTEWDIAG